MWGIEMMEGKDTPKERRPPEHNEKGKMVGLLLRMLRPLYHTASAVALGSGFYVVQGVGTHNYLTFPLPRIVLFVLVSCLQLRCYQDSSRVQSVP